MSYTIAVRARKEDKAKMLGFLEEHYRGWRELVQIEGSFGGTSLPTDQVDHDGFPNTTIGFNYKSWLGGWERDYIYAVLHWVALKVGDRVFTGGGKTPYIIYEGETVFPVIGEGTDPEIAVKALGPMCYSNTVWDSPLDGAMAILQELRRLDDLWIYNEPLERREGL